MNLTEKFTPTNVNLRVGHRGLERRMKNRQANQEWLRERSGSVRFEDEYIFSYIHMLRCVILIIFLFNYFRSNSSIFWWSSKVNVCRCEITVKFQGKHSLVWIFFGQILTDFWSSWFSQVNIPQFKKKIINILKQWNFLFLLG